MKYARYISLYIVSISEENLQMDSVNSQIHRDRFPYLVHGTIVDISD